MFGFFGGFFFLPSNQLNSIAYSLCNAVSRKYVILLKGSFVGNMSWLTILKLSVLLRGDGTS